MFLRIGPLFRRIGPPVSQDRTFSKTNAPILKKHTVFSAFGRLTLQSAQQHRVWEASMLDTFLGPTDSAIITAMQEAGVRYHQETQNMRHSTPCSAGPPHVHVFGAMTSAPFRDQNISFTGHFVANAATMFTKREEHPAEMQINTKMQQC